MTNFVFSDRLCQAIPIQGTMGNLKKNKLVLLGVDTGFMMEVSVCPRKSLLCDKSSDSGTLDPKDKKFQLPL